MSEPKQAVLRIGYSPDPDDAFMWWPLLAADPAEPLLATGEAPWRFRFEPIVEDIESLNVRAEAGELEITAMSCAQYPQVRDRYVLTACGASLGDGYGPKLVAAEPLPVEDLTAPGVVIAVPGTRTSAFGATSLRLGAGAFRHEVVPFDGIIDRVAAGEFAAGLVIHEGQLTYREAGLHLVEDLGAWWTTLHHLPLPLGVNTIRRDLERDYGPGTLAEVTSLLGRSVTHALAHRRESIEHALPYARNMSAETADEFVAMYVNAWTVDFGPTGRSAVRTFLAELARAGLVPDPEPVEFVGGAGTPV